MNEDQKESVGECGNCGGKRCKYTVHDYQADYDCPECGEKGTDFFEDLYGVMSVPWGFLL